MKKKALVIGSHVSESLSPFIFNYWLKKYNINAKYFFKEIKPENFKKEIEGVLNDQELLGFNVTIPFKELIKDKVCSLDKHSTSIGAVNCVSNVNKKWVGKNTDWLGFYKSIENIVKNNNPNVAFVFGYGGASKAILYTLNKLGIKKINVYNRTEAKIKELDKKSGFSIIKYIDIPNLIESSDIIINTTPTNILKDVFSKKEQKNIFAFDIVYRPKETDFLSYFKKEKRIYGLSMLINQAAPCFEEWFGIKPIVDEGLYNLLDKKAQQ